jgi:hypothetical protein
VLVGSFTTYCTLLTTPQESKSSLHSLLRWQVFLIISHAHTSSNLPMTHPVYQRHAVLTLSNMAMIGGTIKLCSGALSITRSNCVSVLRPSSITLTVGPGSGASAIVYNTVELCSNASAIVYHSVDTPHFITQRFPDAGALGKQSCKRSNQIKKQQ